MKEGVRAQHLDCQSYSDGIDVNDNREFDMENNPSVYFSVFLTAAVILWTPLSLPSPILFNVVKCGTV